jgi:signal transduction histidine kinase
LKRWREVSLELEVLDSYRQTISLEFKARQVHYAGRDCVQWVGRDISARKEAERLRQDLLNMLVHDLRGPIGNLINTIELLPMLLTSTDDPSTINRLLDLAMQTSQEVKDLVDSMLDVSRLEQGEVPLQPEMIRVEDLVAAVEKQVTARAESKAIELVIEPVPEISPVWLDSGMIRRVLVNLLDNGIKYTPHTGKVSLTTTVTEDSLTFIVADNGPGISKADQKQIFDKFSRVDYSSNAPSGVGLGLAFCKLATEAHGGTISVESEGLAGQGSTFYLSLPLILEPPR